MACEMDFANVLSLNLGAFEEAGVAGTSIAAVSTLAGGTLGETFFAATVDEEA